MRHVVGGRDPSKPIGLDLHPSRAPPVPPLFPPLTVTEHRLTTIFSSSFLSSNNGETKGETHAMVVANDEASFAPPQK